jgi:hypothetical protein
MEGIIIGVLGIIIVVGLNIMGCMPTTNPATMTLGDLAWTNVVLSELITREKSHREKSFPQTLHLKSSLSMTSFAMHFALKLVSLLKQLIRSEKMPREMSRSGSRVE